MAVWKPRRVEAVTEEEKPADDDSSKHREREQIDLRTGGLWERGATGHATLTPSHDYRANVVRIQLLSDRIISVPESPRR